MTTALAKRTLQKGDFVALYEGTLTRKPTKEEWARNMTFGVGDYYVVGNGCAASQILHSCSPNTVAQVWIDRGDCGTLDRRCIAVFVCKKVDKGRPLGLNYGWLPSNTVATGIPCRCAALRGVCSGYVGVYRAASKALYSESLTANIGVSFVNKQNIRGRARGMAKGWGVSAALLLLVAPLASAQTAPQRVNVTAGDGFLAIEWNIPTIGGDVSIRSFTGE